jgi:hypothetical protein
MKGYIRFGLIAIWAILFTAYMSLFVIQLRRWDNEVPLRCYKTSAVARPEDSHPHVDNIYVAVTFTFIVVSLYYALIVSLNLQTRLRKKLSDPVSWLEVVPLPESSVAAFRVLSMSMDTPATDLQYTLLSIAMLQSPLHIYSIFALRASNERYLEEGSSEREWGFGQIVAMVLLGGNILQVVDGVAGMFCSTVRV